MSCHGKNQIPSAKGNVLQTTQRISKQGHNRTATEDVMHSTRELWDPSHWHFTFSLVTLLVLLFLAVQHFIFTALSSHENSSVFYLFMPKKASLDVSLNLSFIFFKELNFQILQGRYNNSGVNLNLLFAYVHRQVHLLLMQVNS